MTLAIYFATPLLLIGLLAAAVPFVLHLLASVRAQEAYFPTLRMLRKSMEKTARRRRIQNWLLLMLRSILLAALAVGVAEPISRSAGGWSAGQDYAAVIVLDTSYSMAARTADGSTRLARGVKEATEVLSGDARPALAALVCTGAPGPVALTSDTASLRKALSAAAVSYSRADIAQCVRSAIETLNQNASSPHKSIFVISDLQRASFDELPQLSTLADARGIHIFVINVAPGAVNNVGISDVEISGRRIVDQMLEFSATIINSSPTDRKVNVALRVDGRNVGQPMPRVLGAAGGEGAIARVTFYHSFSAPGPVQGEIALDAEDDLAADNVRRFAIEVAPRVGALLVRGPAADVPMLDPALHLLVSLEPYRDGKTPWSITPRIVQAAGFKAADLDGVSIVYLSDVSRLTDQQAAALRDFVRRGGTLSVFLGPSVDMQNYNAMLGDLLPGKLAAAVGEVGSAADAVAAHRVDATHPYFAGLYESFADYPAVYAYRYFQLTPDSKPDKVLIALRNGDPLVCARQVGLGQVVLCTTTACPLWSNFCVTGLFLPMVSRMSLCAPRQALGDSTFSVGAAVSIRPSMGAARQPASVNLNVSLPTDDGREQLVKLEARDTPEGLLAVFRDTGRVGTYTWQVAGALTGTAVGGTFVVNPSGPESNLAAVPPVELQRALGARGLEHAFVASSVQEALSQAASAAAGRNWWDLVLAAAILLLVAEAVVANRRRATAQALPPHLNPKLSDV
jgi:hypothetical protein